MNKICVFLLFLLFITGGFHSLIYCQYYQYQHVVIVIIIFIIITIINYYYYYYYYLYYYHNHQPTFLLSLKLIFAMYFPAATYQFNIN